jgi:hypothetical protein
MEMRGGLGGGEWVYHTVECRAGHSCFVLYEMRADWQLCTYTCALLVYLMAYYRITVDGSTDLHAVSPVAYIAHFSRHSFPGSRTIIRSAAEILAFLSLFHRKIAPSPSPIPKLLPYVLSDLCRVSTSATPMLTVRTVI